MSRETAWTILTVAVYMLVGLSIGLIIEGSILGDIRRMAMGACAVSLSIACAVWLTLLQRFEL